MFLRNVLLSQRTLWALCDGPSPSSALRTSERFVSCDSDSRQIDSLVANFSIRKSSSSKLFPANLNGDVHLLLSVGNRYELYQFLRRLTTTKRFFSEIEDLLTHHELNFPKILNLASMYSWNEKADGIDALGAFTEAHYPNEYEAHGKFLPHKIVSERSYDPVRVLTRLLDLASEDAALKAVILAQAELVLNKVVSCGSLSVVDKVNEFIATSTSADLKGPLLCSSWTSLYLSPYQRDRAAADKILGQNEEAMLPHLNVTLSQVAEHLLFDRQLNRYHALLELFSKQSHRTRTRALLEKLFLHYYNTNNVKGCKSCVTLAFNLKLELAHDIKYKWEVMNKSALPMSSAYIAYRF